MMEKDDSHKFMKMAILQAKQAFAIDEVPIGAVIVKNHQIIAKAYNRTITDHNPLNHCELIALQQASKKLLSWRLDDCDIYITAEPCAMCLGAISMARIKKIYYAVAEPKFGAIESNQNFFKNYPAYFKPEIYSAINEEESRELLQMFFQKKRL